MVMSCAWILVFLLFFWQFKVLKKYAFGYDSFKLKIAERYVVVNGARIDFEEIDYITVKELEQPSDLEKAFSKSAFYAYMTEVTFHLKGGFGVTCRFNSKRVLYRALKQLEPFVQIHGNIEYFKPQIRWIPLLIIVASIILIFLTRL